MARVVPKVVGYAMINGQRVEVMTDMPMLQFLNDVINGSDPDSPGINTVLAGVNRAEAKVDGVIDGTQVLATVTTADGGNLPAAIGVVGAGAGAMASVILDRYTLTNNTPLLGAGLAITQTVTATPNFGTGPYTQAWTIVSGSAFTINNPTGLFTDFQIALGDGSQANAIARITITDSLLATATADVAVNAYSTPLN